VLRLGKVRRGGEAYYLRTTLAGGSDGTGLVEPDGLWSGRVANYLGIEGPVEAFTLETLLGGFHPSSGEALDDDHGRVKVSAFDVMMAAPKSVSVLHALAPREVVSEVRGAHESSVAAAFAYAERQAAFVRRNGRSAPASGFVAATFVHRTSRALDPHLHSHVVIANLAQGGDGGWSAVDARALYAHAGSAGALYRAQLRHELAERLGVAWQARSDGFADLIGISPRALRGFSRRSAEIAAELARDGRSGPLAKSLAAVRTRPEKDTSISYGALVDGWKERALDLGLAAGEVDRLGAAGRRSEPERDDDLEERVASAARGFERPFVRRELVRETCARLGPGAPAGRIEEAVGRHLSKEMVHAGGTRLTLGRGAARFPIGVLEERFASPEIADLSERLGGEFADAHRLERAELPERPGVFRFESADAASFYAGLRAIALDGDANGMEAVLLASSRRAALHLEAVTGIEPADWRSMAALRDGTVVIEDARRCPLRSTVGLLEEAEERRLAIVLAERPGGETADPPAVAVLANRPAERFDFGVRAAVAADLPAAVAEIARLARQARAEGREPLVVSCEPSLLAGIDATIVRPGSLRALLGTQGGQVVITLGGARLLEGGLDRIGDCDRAHVAVSPVSRHVDERTFALGLAEPRTLRSSLGRYPESAAGRCVWRVRAASIELAGREMSDSSPEIGGRHLLRESLRRPGLSRAIR
jgi:conjugative relaxase-like TrwC/TraI family protein